jgi:NAD(P)-dependent dehydrogenase (short-subunit alcohol dehydrogenase family)
VDLQLSGKGALITGAGGGIGRETALLLAREGARIAAADVRLAARATDGVLEAVVDVVPAEWVDDRETYAQYLRARLAAPREFAEEAERARAAA